MTKKTDSPTPRSRIGDRVTIYPRGKKRIFVAEFWLNGHHRKSLKTRNLKVARRRAAEIEAELAAGTFKRQPPKVTITEGARMYLAYLTTENRAKRTLAKYAGQLRQFAAFMRRHHVLQLGRVTLALLDQYRAHRKEHIADSTLYNETTVIVQFYKWSMSRALLATNPIADCKLAKPTRLPKRAPTLEQVHAILQECCPRLATRILILAATGMRAGELQGLSKSDVDLQSGFVHVCKQIGGPTKTKSQRKIPIHSRIRDILGELLAEDSHDLLVTSLPSRMYPDGGRPVNLKRLTENFKAAARRAGINGFTTHDLRRHFNTICVNSGIPERVVRLWMGHHDRSMTGVYYDLNDEESRRFMSQVPFGTASAAGDVAIGDVRCTTIQLSR